MTPLYLFVVAMLFGFVASFQQNDYTIVHHRIELISYNRTVTRDTKIELTPFNRTVRAIKASFYLKIDVYENILLSIQAFKFTSNEYRLFPLGFDIDFCKLQKEDVFGTADLIKYSNIISCPLHKGFYYCDNYRPDESKFPPHLVPGDYKVVFNVTHNTAKWSEIHWYGSIKKIEKLWT